MCSRRRSERRVGRRKKRDFMLKGGPDHSAVYVPSAWYLANLFTSWPGVVYIPQQLQQFRNIHDARRKNGGRAANADPEAERKPRASKRDSQSRGDTAVFSGGSARRDIALHKTINHGRAPIFFAKKGKTKKKKEGRKNKNALNVAGELAERHRPASTNQTPRESLIYRKGKTKTNKQKCAKYCQRKESVDRPSIKNHRELSICRKEKNKKKRDVNKSGKKQYSTDQPRHQHPLSRCDSTHTGHRTTTKNPGGHGRRLGKKLPQKATARVGRREANTQAPQHTPETASKKAGSPS